jgi:two-component system, LytTR family, response regulator
MIKCLIVDDEEDGLKNIKGLILENCTELIISGQARSVAEAVQQIKAAGPQLLFLDIEMTDGTGFDVLAQCSDVPMEVIFVTAYNQYGLNAIKFSAIDYILKPIDTGQFCMAVEKAVRQIEMKTENIRLRNLLYNVGQTKGNQRIALPFTDTIEFVEVRNIIRLEADGSYTRFHLFNTEEYLVSGSLKEYDEILSVHGFIRTHQAHLVNPNYIKSMVKTDGGYLLLQNGANIPISRLRKSEVIQKLKG